MNGVWPSIILRCAQLTFAALIVAALASTLSFTRLPPPEVTSTEEMPVVPSARLPLEHFALIAERNIFRLAGPPLDISGTLPKTRLDLELVGTIVVGVGARPGARSLALVRDGKDPVSAVPEGESFGGGRIRLVSIEPRRIVIENAGLLEVVALASEQEEPAQKTAELQIRPSQGPRAAAPSAAVPSAAAPSSDANVLQVLRAAANVPAPGSGEPTAP